MTYLSVAGFSKTMPFVYLSIASRSTLLYLQCLSLDTSERSTLLSTCGVLLVAFLQEGDFARSTFFMRAI